MNVRLASLLPLPKFM